MLVKKISVVGRSVHPFSIRAYSAGCVFTDSKLYYEGYDSLDRTGPSIDLHGTFPYENLLDNIRGMYVHSGGALDVLPHAGVRNTFWNIRTPDELERFPDAQNEFLNTTAAGSNTMYKHYPNSILVGVYGREAIINLKGGSTNRTTDAVTIEAFNDQDIPFASLYKAQLYIRKNGATPPPVTEIDLTPTDDSYLRGGASSNDNYGSEGIVRTKTSADGAYTRWPILKFDVNNLSGSIESAVLSLYIDYISDGESSSAENQVYLISDDSGWNENTATWGNLPTLESSVATFTVNSADSGIKEIDLTSFAQSQIDGDGTLSICIKCNTQQFDIKYGSKENANISKRPVLTIIQQQ